MAYAYDSEPMSSPGWVGLNSSDIYGSPPGTGLGTMLDGTGSFAVVGAGASPWSNQEFFLYLGGRVEVSSIRYRSDIIGNVTKFDVFISDTYGSWGSAVATDLNPSATSSYRETSITPTIGRYVRVLIKDSDFGSLGVYTWGGVGVGNGLDLYGSFIYTYDSEASSGFIYNQASLTYNQAGIIYNQNDTYSRDTGASAGTYSYDSEP